MKLDVEKIEGQVIGKVYCELFLTFFFLCKFIYEVNKTICQYGAYLYTIDIIRSLSTHLIEIWYIRCYKNRNDHRQGFSAVAVECPM